MYPTSRICCFAVPLKTCCFEVLLKTLLNMCKIVNYLSEYINTDCNQRGFNPIFS